MDEFELTTEPWPSPKPKRHPCPLYDPPQPNDVLWVYAHRAEMTDWLSERIQSALGDLRAKYPVLSVRSLQEMFLEAGILVDSELDRLAADEEATAGDDEVPC